MNDLYCVFGNPVAHSKSPAIHAAFATACGQQLRYEARLAAVDGFSQAVPNSSRLAVRERMSPYPSRKKPSA